MSGKAKNTTGSKVGASKVPAKAPSSKKSSSKTSKSFAATHEHLFSKKPRSFGIGRAIPPTRDLSRYVLWPKYIRLQRQRAILKKEIESSTIN